MEGINFNNPNINNIQKAENAPQNTAPQNTQAPSESPKENAPMLPSMPSPLVGKELEETLKTLNSTQGSVIYNDTANDKEIIMKYGIPSAPKPEAPSPSPKGAPDALSDGPAVMKYGIPEDIDQLTEPSEPSEPEPTEPSLDGPAVMKYGIPKH